jgi:hypothetical protein
MAQAHLIGNILMSIADKFRKIRGRIIQDEAGLAVFKSDDIKLETVQPRNILERGSVENISVDELKKLAEHYGKQLLIFLDEIEGAVEQKSNSKIALIADFIKVIQNADRIVEFPAIEKLVKDAAKSVEE